MLYGGPLGTYLSGYYGPGSSKSGSPSFTSTGSGPSATSSYSRPRTGRYRTPSAYGVTSSGTSATTSLAPNSSRSNFYTPQTRRKYSDENIYRTSSIESPGVNRSRYTTPSGTPVNLNNSSTTGSSGYYSRPSPSYTSSSSASTVLSPSTVTPSATTVALVSPPPSSYARAATLSPYDSVPRRSQSQNRSRRLYEPLYFPHFRFTQGAVEPNLDYKRLYESEKADNQDLKTQIEKAQAELRELRAKVDEARRLPSQQQHSSQRINSFDSDQRMLEELRATSEKLKAEHRALTGILASNALTATKQLCSMISAGNARFFAVVVSNPPNSPSTPPLSISYVAALYGLPVIVAKASARKSPLPATRSVARSHFPLVSLEGLCSLTSLPTWSSSMSDNIVHWKTSVSARQAAFSNKYAHASFLRTVPPYVQEAKIWAQLIGAFEWHEVIIIHSDNNHDSKALIARLEAARQTVDFKSLSTETKVLSAKIKAKMSADVPNISTITASINCSKTSTQSPIKPVPPKMLPTATPVEATNDDMKLRYC
ncbi:hypothetical protein ACTXT7_003199 [Hymenolepis weldensis]